VTEAPATVICHFRVKASEEKAFLELRERHWPTLRRLDLVTDEPPVLYRGEDAQGRPQYWEIFTWEGGAAARAHEHPEVLAIWEPMEAACEARDGRPSVEFPHVERVPNGW